MVRVLFWCVLLVITVSSQAHGQGGGLGAVALDIREPISLIIELVRSVSIISGAGLVLGGFLKYMDHRRNPVAVRLSAVIFMFIFGAALISVGFIPMPLA